MKKAMFLIAALLVAPAWAVNKCTGPDGKVAFQDAPCVGKGEKIEVLPASGGTPPPYLRARHQWPPFSAPPHPQHRCLHHSPLPHHRP